MTSTTGCGIGTEIVVAARASLNGGFCLRPYEISENFFRYEARAVKTTSPTGADGAAPSILREA
jgi:hypothetical protein